MYIVSESFPESEKFGITSQLRGAALSVSNNVAEGNSRLSKKDQVDFFQMAYASLMEVLNISIVCLELRYLNEKTHVELRELIEEISNKLRALHASKSR
jgi:four helix bundle protein